MVKWTNSAEARFNAANFRALRERLGLTQAEIAKAYSTTTPKIKRWERGETPVPLRAFGLMKKFEETLAIAADIGSNFEFAESSNPGTVRIPIFRFAGELIWWTTTLHLPYHSFINAFAIAEAFPNFSKLYRTKLPNGYGANRLSSEYRKLLLELAEIEDSPFHKDADKALAEAVAKTTSITRVNTFFRAIATGLDTKNIPYSYYYPADLAKWETGKKLTPIFEEEAYLNQNFGNLTPPAEAYAKTLNDYELARTERLAAGSITGGCKWSIVGDKTLVLEPADPSKPGALPNNIMHTNDSPFEPGWYRNEIKRIVIQGNLSAEPNSENMFINLTSLESADLSGLSNANANALFKNCPKLSIVE